jgi:hypothetical protein
MTVLSSILLPVSTTITSGQDHRQPAADVFHNFHQAREADVPSKDKSHLNIGLPGKAPLILQSDKSHLNIGLQGKSTTDHHPLGCQQADPHLTDEHEAQGFL